MKRKSIVYLIFTAIVCLVIGTAVGIRFGSGDEDTSPQPKKVFAMNVVVSGVPFWNETREVWQRISEVTPDVRTVFGGPLDTDAQKQVTEIESLLARGLDGLVVAPTDSSALIPILKRAAERGVPVVTYLIDAPGSGRLTYVTSELEGASKRVGDYIARIADFKGKCIISYAQAGIAEQEARKRGFEELIKEHPGMELVTVIEDQYDEHKGVERLKPLLTKHPDIKMIFGCNSRSAISASVALREAGFSPGQALVSGWDYDVDLLNRIKEDWVQASVAQLSAYMTQLCFATLNAHSKGYLFPQSLSLEKYGVNPLPDTIIVPVALVTKDNVDAYYPRTSESQAKQ